MCQFLLDPSPTNASYWILFKLDLSKLFHGFLLVVRWICQNWYLDLSDLLHGFVKIDTWSSLSCYMDLLELLRGFVKVVCIFQSLFAKQTKLKLDQDFKVCWSFYFGLEVLNESKYAMPWVRCAFWNVSFSYEENGQQCAYGTFLECWWKAQELKSVHMASVNERWKKCL